MSTLAKAKKSARPSAAERARRAKLARIRRAEDKADIAIAKEVCARIDSGEEKPLSREQFLREMGL